MSNPVLVVTRTIKLSGPPEWVRHTLDNSLSLGKHEVSAGKVIEVEAQHEYYYGDTQPKNASSHGFIGVDSEPAGEEAEAAHGS